MHRQKREPGDYRLEIYDNYNWKNTIKLFLLAFLCIIASIGSFMSTQNTSTKEERANLSFTKVNQCLNTIIIDWNVLVKTL